MEAGDTIVVVKNSLIKNAENRYPNRILTWINLKFCESAVIESPSWSL